MISTLRIEVNEDGQFVVTDRAGDEILFGPLTISRERTLFMASAVFGRRVCDGTLDPAMSLGDVLRRLGAIEARCDQGDRVLIERWEDAA